MDLDLSPEQLLIQKTARDFATREVLPHAAAIDRDHRFPAEIIAKMGKLGLMGMMVPPSLGGAGLD
ncbi:MAG TPA: acyl-CoA dehydrogenase family protein, partial [Polyangia bacterium]|nr:acyl-CoA dehydrogenase family protein [Polyangia bacterium]